MKYCYSEDATYIKFYGCHHELVNRYEISIFQMVMNLFLLYVFTFLYHRKSCHFWIKTQRLFKVNLAHTFTTKETILSFHIVNFPFLDVDIPLAPSHAVYITQLVPFVRNNVSDFIDRNLVITENSFTPKVIENFHKCVSLL